MGLDISLYIPTEEEGFKDYIIDECWKDFKEHLGEDVIKTKMYKCFDFEALGVFGDRYQMKGVEYSEDLDIYEFEDTESPFYKLREKICDNNSIIDPSKLTKEIKDELISSGIVEYFKKDKYDINLDTLAAVTDWDDEPYYDYIYHYLTDKCTVTLREDEIPTKEEEFKILHVKEIGYQRKGLNDLFYKEYTDEDYYVFTKERLQYIYDRYVLDNAKHNFKEQILDKHIDGKTFVIFDW